MTSIDLLPDITVFQSTMSNQTPSGVMHLTFNCFLMDSASPVLVHSGTVSQVEQMLPLLRNRLSGRTLRYVFASHFESDECGGVQLLKEHYPELVMLCSANTARELAGFGMDIQPRIVRGGEVATDEGFSLQMIDYPSEAHLEKGLIAFEQTRGLLFSSDLLGQIGL
ncbi:MBL fold metallo-hydrolase, partial [Eubacteriales bacterium OttesenSCG-928-N14]|nr:MBL fold metallo-hydrolase [Eubacteriales bacterium OttesenSCG-928-N14]